MLMPYLTEMLYYSLLPAYGVSGDSMNNKGNPLSDIGEGMFHLMGIDMNEPIQPKLYLVCVVDRSPRIHSQPGTIQ